MTDVKASNSAQSAAEAAIEAQSNDPSWEPIVVNEEEELLCFRELVTADDAQKNELGDDYVGNFRYPIDMNDESLVSTIEFEAQFVEGANLAEPVLEGLRYLGDSIRNFVSDGDAPADETEEQKKARQEEEQQLEQNVVDDLTSAQQRTAYELPSGTPVGSVRLYLPQSIVFTDGVQYNTAELGILGGIGERVFGGSNGGEGGASIGADGSLTPAFRRVAQKLTTKGGLTGIGALIGSVGGKAKNKTISTLAGAAVGTLGANAVGQGLESVTRTTTNPNVRSLFKSVNLRNFQFSFRMVAQSHDEAEEIKRIVQFFRTQVYPETLQLAGIPFGYIFPNIFRIYMFHGQNRLYNNQILPCYLESVTVTYNPSGQGMHSDGNWTDVDIQLRFVEVTTLDKNKIKEGY